MAGKYTYRLTAEGFAEFQAQLAQLGDAGVAAFDKIKATMPQFADAASKAEARAIAAKQRLEEMARTDFSRLAASLDPVIAKQQQLAEGQATIATARAAGVIGAQEEANALALLEQRYGSASAGVAQFSQGLSKATSLLGTLGIGVSIAGLLQLERGIFDTTAALDNQAKTLGISVEQFQAYHGGAILAGAAADTGDAAIQRFTRSLGSNNKAFLELGLTANNLAGGTAGALTKTAQALLSIADVSTRARLEFELFGKSGQKVEQLLEQWADPNILQHMKDMGLVIDQELTQRAEAADRAFTLLWQKIKVGSAEVLFGGPSAGQQAVKNLLGNPSDIGLGTALPFANSSTQGIAFASSSSAAANADITGYYQANAKAIADIERAREEANKKAIEDAKHAAEEKQKIEDGIVNYYSIAADKISTKEVEAAKQAAEERQKIEDGIVNYYSIAADKISTKEVEAAKHAADELARDQQRAADQSERYWDRMFDNMFQSGSFNFKKLLANIATEAIARPIIVPVMMQVAGAIGLGGLGTTGSSGISGLLGGGGSTAGAGGGGLLSGLGTVGNLFSSGGGLGGILGTAGSIANGNVGTGILGFLDGTSNAGAALGGIGGIFGGGLGGLGIGSLVGSITGNKTGSSIGGALGGAIGSIIPGVGTIIGSIAGSLLGGLFGNNKPSNYTAWANFGGDLSTISGPLGDKPNQNTIAAAQQAGQAIAAAAQKLKDAGIDINTNITRLQIGQRDASQLVLSTGQKIQVGGVGDVQAAVSGTLNYALQSASSRDSVIQAVISKYKAHGGVTTANIDQLIADVNNATALTKANADFAASLAASLSAGALPKQLTAVETAMKALTTTFSTTSEKARSLNLDITQFADATKAAFDSEILNSITAIQNPLKSALDLWQRDAQARLDAAASIGADIGQVTQLNNLLHQQIVSQVYGNTVSSLQGLQNGIRFGSSSAASPDQQFFAAMTQYNTAKSSALGSLDPNDIASFESAAQSFLPIARDFLGTSERFAAITGDVQDTVSQLISGISTRENTAPDLTPVVQATNDGAAAVVDAVNNASAAAQAQASDLQQQIADLTATVADQATQIQQLNASTTAVVMRYAGARVGSP